MAQSLGSINIELSANTAKFTEGLSKAAYAAQQSAKSISREFASLQKVASQTFSPFASFSPAISQFSFVLSEVGRAASSASKEFGSLKTAAGAITSIAAGAGAAIGALALSAVALAEHTAESAAKMYEMSQSTGVPIKTLSSLAFGAKQTGVDMEQLGVGLERLSKSAFAAATAPAGTISAYSRLGVSVRDAAGNMRPVNDILMDVSDRFSAMQDGTTKSALAMQLFGRSGDAMIPFLNLGAQKISEFEAQSDRLGTTLSGDTGRAAEEFQSKLGAIKQAAEGAALSLTRFLLPALSGIASELEKISEGPKSFLINAAEDLAALAVAGTEGLAALEALRGKMQQVNDEGRDPISGERPGAKTGFAAADAFFKLPSNIDAGLKGIPVASTEKDTVADMIAKLSAEAEAQEALATATDRTTGAMVLQKAAAEAAKDISEERANLLDREASLTNQFNNAKAEGRTNEAAGFKLQIDAIEKMLAELKTATPQIEALKARALSSEFANTGDNDVQKFIEKTQESIANAQARAAAYAKGPQAVAGAEEQAKVAPFQQQLADLGDLRDAGTITAVEYGVLSDQINAAIAKIHELSLAEALPATAKLTSDTNLQIAALNRLTAAAFGSAAALRAAETENKVQEFAKENPFADLAAVRKQYELNAAAQHSSEIATLAAQLDVSVGYQRQADQLSEIAEKYSDNKNVVLAAAAAEYDALQKLTKELDEQALKAGTFGQKMHTVLDQMALDAENAGAKIAESIGKAIDSLEDSIAKFAVTGKGNFKQIAQSFAESSIKTGLQTTIGGIEKAFDFKTPGAKRDGSSAANALFVTMAGASGATVGSTSLIGSLFGKLGTPGSGTTPPFLAGSSSLIGSLFHSQSAIDDSGTAVSGPSSLSSIAGIFSRLGTGISSVFKGIFGGFLASGGDVTPGKAYMVGEKGPEPFFPKQAGTIVPHGALQMGGGGNHTTVHMHIHGVPNPDDFRRSQTQIFSNMHAQLTHANSRNG